MSRFIDKLCDSSPISKARIGKHIAEGLTNYHTHHTGTTDARATLLRERSKALGRVSDAESDILTIDSANRILEEYGFVSGFSKDAVFRLLGFDGSLAVEVSLQSKDFTSESDTSDSGFEGLWVTLYPSESWGVKRFISLTSTTEDGLVTERMFGDFVEQLRSFMALLRSSGSVIYAIDNALEVIDDMDFDRFKLVDGSIVKY